MLEVVVSLLGSSPLASHLISVDVLVSWNVKTVPRLCPLCLATNISGNMPSNARNCVFVGTSKADL